MSHVVELPDDLFESLQGIATARGTDPVEAIDFALKQTFGGGDAHAKSQVSASTLGERLRRSMVVFEGRPGTEGLSEQQYEMSEDEIRRMMGLR